MTPALLESSQWTVVSRQWSGSLASSKSTRSVRTQRFAGSNFPAASRRRTSPSTPNRSVRAAGQSAPGWPRTAIPGLRPPGLYSLASARPKQEISNRPAYLRYGLHPGTRLGGVQGSRLKVWVGLGLGEALCGGVLWPARGQGAHILPPKNHQKLLFCLNFIIPFYVYMGSRQWRVDSVAWCVEGSEIKPRDPLAAFSGRMRRNVTPNVPQCPKMSRNVPPKRAERDVRTERQRLTGFKCPTMSRNVPLCEKGGTERDLWRVEGGPWEPDETRRNVTVHPTKPDESRRNPTPSRSGPDETRRNPTKADGTRHFAKKQAGSETCARGFLEP